MIWEMWQDIKTWYPVIKGIIGLLWFIFLIGVFIYALFKQDLYLLVLSIGLILMDKLDEILKEVKKLKK